MKPDIADKLKLYADLTRGSHAIVNKVINGSSKLERAAEEMQLIEGYLREIAQLPDGGKLDRLSIAFRLIGCAGLIKLVATDICVRLKGRPSLDDLPKMLAVIGSEIHSLGQNFAADAPRNPQSLFQLGAAQRASELARVDYQWETTKASRRKV